jgi:hypothetical protein
MLAARGVALLTARFHPLSLTGGTLVVLEAGGRPARVGVRQKRPSGKKTPADVA